MGREQGRLRAKDEDERGEDVCRQMLTGRGHAKGTSRDSGVPSARDISADSFEDLSGSAWRAVTSQHLALTEDLCVITVMKRPGNWRRISWGAT